MPGTDEQEYGSPPQGGRRRWPAIIAGVAGGMVLVLAAAVSAAFLFWADSKVERLDVDGIQPVGEPGDLRGPVDPDLDLDLEDVVNVLVVGSDAREGLTDEQRRALSAGNSDGERTDTIMLVRLDPKQDSVSLLSFPRDLLVTRCDGSRGRINAAFQIGEETGAGGPSCLVQTITDFSGLPVHHYVAVDFPGFIELVDLVGGVTVYLEHPIDDWRANLDLPAGCNRLDGETALGFARHRASDSDYGRVARQQRLVKELVDEATRLGNLLNLPRTLRMIEVASQAVQTDRDLSLDLMRRIAFTFRELDGQDDVVARTVPGDFQMIDGVAYEVPIEEQAEQLFAAFQAGTMPDQPHQGEAEAADGDADAADTDREDGEADPAVNLAPGDVPPVVVLNGAGVAGLAARAQTHLEDEGFSVAGIDNADDYARAVTEVRHPSALATEAEVVAAHLPAAELVAVDDLESIVVVLGSDFDADADPAQDADVLVDSGREDAEDGQDEGPDDDGEDAEGAAPPRFIDQEFVGAQPPPEHCYE